MVVCGPAARSGGSLCHHHRGRAPHLHNQHDHGARDREPCQLGWCSQFHRCLLWLRHVSRPEYGRHLSYPLPRLDGGQRFRGKPLQYPRRDGGQIGRYDLLRLHALPSGPVLALAAGRHDHEDQREMFPKSLPTDSGQRLSKRVSSTPTSSPKKTTASSTRCATT